MFNSKVSWRLPLIILLALLGGCVTRSSFVSEENRLQKQRAQIQNLYVYSFLDARADFFGDAFLKELQAQLDRRLASEGVKLEWLWYQKSMVGAMSALQEIASPGGTGSAVQLPVPLLVVRNLPAEARARSTHRLIIFPRSVGLAGRQVAERAYTATIAWTLIEIKTGEIILSGRSETWGKPLQPTEDTARQVADVVNDFMAVAYPPLQVPRP
ncbi:hypothetical protein [Pseudomonas capsici]|uniref:hypothetical protein n=1 Tax=Pseudomonas capsici TaxID=2810614 RepID=UPI0021F1DC86|nr:hypothetical protein [Pseudomonas capsici]MCV4341665.1 hypothetical protein [Pseudomonas capsici]